MKTPVAWAGCVCVYRGITHGCEVNVSATGPPSQLVAFPTSLVLHGGWLPGQRLRHRRSVRRSPADRGSACPFPPSRSRGKRQPHVPQPPPPCSRIPEKQELRQKKKQASLADRGPSRLRELRGFLATGRYEHGAGERSALRGEKPPVGGT